MGGRHLLGSEGHDHQHPTGLRIRSGGLPPGQEGDGEAIGPLAVVEHYQGRVIPRPQRVEQRRQRIDAPGLGVLLRSEPLRRTGPQRTSQVGQRRHDGAGPVAEVVPHGFHRRGIQVVGGDAGHDTVEHLEGPLRSVIDALAPQHPEVLPGGVEGELVEKARLPPAGLRLDEDQLTVAGKGLADHPREAVELEGPRHEGRLGERATEIVAAERQGRLRDPRLESG